MNSHPFFNQARIQAAMDAEQIELHNFVDSLPIEQLASLIKLIGNIYAAPNCESAAAFHLGQMTTVMRVKYNRCVCGGDHDADALAHAEAQMRAGLPADDGAFSQGIFMHPAGGSINVEVEMSSGKVRCINCKTVFDGIHERFDSGLACPSCGATT